MLYEEHQKLYIIVVCRCIKYQTCAVPTILNDQFGCTSEGSPPPPPPTLKVQRSDLINKLLTYDPKCEATPLRCKCESIYIIVDVAKHTNGSFSDNTSCSNLTVTNGLVIRIAGSSGAVSGVTCLVALCWLFYLKLYKQFIYRLAAYQVVASLFHALLLESQFTFLEYNDSKYPSCVAVGYLFKIAGWIMACFGCWITFHLFCFAVLLKNMKKLEPLYVISSILFSIVISSIPLITKSYGPTGEWCWIQRKQCGKKNT